MGIRKWAKRWSCRRRSCSLHDAVRRGNRELATKLLDEGASLNATDAKHSDPLHLAIDCRDVGMVQLLVSRAADTEALGPGGREMHFSVTEDQVFGAIEGARQERGGICAVVSNMVLRLNFGFGSYAFGGCHTPLEHAVITNQPGVIDVLVAGGANLSRRNGPNYTLLHMAAEFCCVEATLALLKHGADANAKSDVGHTPLYHAALFPWRKGAAGVVDALLRRGADETICDMFGQTAVDRYEEISSYVPEGDPSAGEVQRVGRALLEIPPANRAWRRRGLLVLYRAHPDRVQAAEGNSSRSHDDMGSCSRSSSGSTGGEGATGATTLCANTGGDLAGVVTGVVELAEEGIFRTLVGYL